MAPDSSGSSSRTAAARRGRIRAPASSLILLAAVVGPAPGMTQATLLGAETVPATLTVETLDPPTAVRCNGGLAACTATLGARPQLSWTATTDLYATGYRVFRSTQSGTGYVQIAELGGRTTTSYTDATGGLSVLATYFYVVTSISPSWTSGNSNEVAVTVVLGL